MAVLGFPSCDSGSYTTPDVKGLLDKRRENFSQRFTKNQEEPIIRRRSYYKRAGWKKRNIHQAIMALSRQLETSVELVEERSVLFLRCALDYYSCSI